MPHPKTRPSKFSPLSLLPLLVCIVGFFTNSVHARQIRLEWDRNPEPDIAGYIVRYGTEPGATLATQETGTTPSTVITGLESGVTYYLAVQAFNMAGLYSDFSEEIAVAIPLPTSPRLSVELADGTTLASGFSTFDLGNLELGSSPSAIAFVVRNLGTATLNDLKFGVSDSRNFSVGAVKKTFLAPGQSMGFTIHFDPEIAGLHLSDVIVTSNDPTAAVFTIGVTGSAYLQPEVVLRRSDKNAETGSEIGFPDVPLSPISGPHSDELQPPSLAVTVAPVFPTSEDYQQVVINDTNADPDGQSGGQQQPEVDPPLISELEDDEDIVTPEKDRRTVRSLVLAARELSKLRKSKQKPMRRVVVIDGRKYRALVIPKTGDFLRIKPRQVQVSADRVDWSSGSKHTEIIRNNSRFMIVRDRSSMSASRKRHIRVQH